MATIDTINIGTDSYELKDATARTTADDAAAQEEWDRQAATATYEGQSIIDLLGAESFDDAVSKLHAKVSAGDFTGLRVMDYLDVTPTKTTVNQLQPMRYRIGEFDYNYAYGDTATSHNVVMVPDAPVDMTGSSYATNTSYIMWSTTATNQGTANEKHPYLASNLHAWEIGEFLPALPASLQAVLVDHRAIMEERYSASGALTDSTGWSWASTGKVFSPSETEVYGTVVWGTKGYSAGNMEQWAVFRQRRKRGMRNGRVPWWLASVQSGSSSGVCYVASYGYAYCGTASRTSVRPLPCFLVG